MRGLPLEVRAAARRLASQPAFLLPTVLILALAIGGNTVLFSIGYSVLARPLPYEEPERLLRLWPDRHVDKMIADRVAREVESLAGASAYALDRFAVGGAEPVLLGGTRVAPRYFELLGVRPVLGRTFRAGEESPGADPVVVVSHALWQARFAGSPGALGASLEIDGRPHTVVGVLPPGHRPVEGDGQLWLPLPVDPADGEDYLGSFYLVLLGRTAPGAGPAAVEEELRGLVDTLRREHPNLITNELAAAATARPLHEVLVAAARPTLLLLAAAVALVLLIACANVANLMQVQAMRRRREIALRAALGGSRGRIVGHVLVESLLLGLVAGLLGLGLAFFLLDLRPLWFPRDLLAGADDAVGGTAVAGTVLLVGLALSVAAALLFGLLPARWALRLDLARQIGETATGAGGLDRRGRRSGRLLVVSQVAVATVLLVVTGWLLTSLARLQAVDPGYEVDRLVSLRLDLPESRYPEPERQVAYYRSALARAAAQPGVESAAAIHLLPLSEQNWSFPYVAADRGVPTDLAPGSSLPTADFRVVTPGYFATVGQRLVAGRDFRPGEGTEVGILDAGLAAELWGEAAAAVGQRVELFGPGGPAFRVVGVVEGARHGRLDEAPRPTLYRPFEQWPVPSMYLLLRTRLPVESLLPGLTAALWKEDSDVPVSEARTLREVVRAASHDERIAGRMLLGFAALAFLLALTGLGAVVRSSVVQRRREMGIRLALGARPAQVGWRVLAEGLALGFAGLVVGMLAGQGAGRLLASRLFEVAPSDAAPLAAVVLLVGAGILVSVLGPALEVSRLRPGDALRGD